MEAAVVGRGWGEVGKARVRVRVRVRIRIRVRSSY